MKKLLFIFILLFGFLSCNSDDAIQYEDEIQIDYSDLIGKWNWLSTCGGVTGECGYPSEENFHSIEFKDNSIYIRTTNESSIQETNYIVTENSIFNSYNLYKISFEDGNSDFFWVQDENLIVGGGSLYIYYEKVID